MTGAGDFWSRRKAAVAAEAEAELAAREAEAQCSDLEDRPDADVLEELGLRDPDELEPGDDFSAFLKQAVPERIRRRALRRLWRTDPTLANLDGLVDYGEDFTDSATVVADLQTAYQVGKGMLQHVLAEQASDEAESGPEGSDALAAGPAGEATPPLDEPVPAESMPDDPALVEPPANPIVAIAEPAETAQAWVSEGPDAEVPDPASAAAGDPPAPAAPVRRRIRFEFVT